jgi:NodT family efflux transporter outer membrane factor (OMF) lipoprotein
MSKKEVYRHLLPLLAYLPLMFLTCGCTVVGPDYGAPELSDKHGGRWQNGQEIGGRTSVTGGAPVAQWWEQFGDSELTRLVNEVVQRNPDLAIAKARIVEAGLGRRLAGAARLPYVDLDGKIIQADTGKKAVNPEGPPPGEDATLFSAGGFAGWELDLWGRVARSVEAADRRYEAEIETYRYVAVSLTAELVLAYIDVRVLEERLRILKANIKLLSKTLELVELRYRTGNSTELDVKQIRRQLNRTSALVPELRRARSVAANRIALLLGLPPAENHLADGTLMNVPDIVGVGLPADLLARRADVRRMERRYAATVATVGSTEAERYPRLSLSGNLYFQTDDLGTLFQPESIIYSLGPMLSFPLFDGGRLQTKVEIRQSQAEQARLELEKTLLVAIGEVENSVVGLIQNQQRVVMLMAAVEDAIRSVDLADQLYQSGLGSLFLVMDAQRELIMVQDELIVAKQFELGEIVKLYRALGGGWDTLASVGVNDGVEGEGSDG